MNKRLLTISLFILAAALSRIIPHAPNFTPMGAMALFAGAYVANRMLAVMFSLVALFLSDMLLQVTLGTGFYGSGMIPVYACTALICLLGSFLQNRTKAHWIAGASLAGSVVFFLITNLVWVYTHSFYPHTFQGVIESYIAGLEFFRNTIAGDLFYSTILFGGYYLLQVNIPALQHND